MNKCTNRPCIAIETTGKDPQTYWFPSIVDLALAYDVSSMKVLRAIEDGRPINAMGVYVDEAEGDENDNRNSN